MSEREAAFVGTRTFQCPECVERFEKPEDLGNHLERHREVTPASDPSPRGKPRSVPCPKDCGRHFPIKEKREFAHHVALCDGSAPIVVVIEDRKEEPVAKLECSKCGKPYKHQKRLESHEESCDGSKESAAAERAPRSGGGDAEPAPGPAAIAPAKDGSVKDQVLEMLDGLDAHYTERLKEVKRLIVAVRGVEEAE